MGKNIFVFIVLTILPGIFVAQQEKKIKGGDPYLFSMQGDLTIISEDDKVVIANNKIKGVFEKKKDQIKQNFYAKKNDEWILVLSSFESPEPFPENGNKLYNPFINKGYRFLASDLFTDFRLVGKKGKKAKIHLLGKKNGVTIKQSLTLEESGDYFHIKNKATFKDLPIKLEYFLSSYIFNLDREPEFVHTPSIKGPPILIPKEKKHLFSESGKDQIIGDRVFYSPSVILQEGELFTAIVPDLELINKYKILSPDARRDMNIPHNQFSVSAEEQNFSMPTGLDLNIKSGLTSKPIFSYGFIDAVATHHMRWPHPNDSSMIRTLNGNEIIWGFDLFVSASAPRYRGFQRVSQHQWKKYGRKLIKKPKPQAMPFAEYVELIYDINTSSLGEIHPPVEGYEDHGSWLEFDINGTPVGGYRNAAPFWNDILSNSPFWNNVRDASGLFFWGKKLGDVTMIDKARRIINLALLAPQNKQGLFPVIYKAAEKKWTGNSFDPPNGANHFLTAEGWDSHSYNVVSMSKTGVHLIDYYRNAEKDERIIPYLQTYANFLITQIDEQGVLPTWYDERGNPSTVLKESAHPAASMWFLAELYRVSKKKEYLKAAEKIAQYIIEKILPTQNWRDLEHYFSCGSKPLSFIEDEFQGQPTRGNLSTLWAAEGFASMFKATRDQKYLDAGEQTIDYLAFYQAVWNPHFIYTAYPFGGFDTDNGDAAWLDARQAEMVEPFIWYGKQLSRQDLLERAVAAARSSITLINHPLHKKNGIYEYTNIYPLGLGPENIDHEGHPQSAMRTSPGWGEGSAVFTGLSDVYREIGGAYVNIQSGVSVGVDGLKITDAVINGNKLKISVKGVLSALKTPWSRSYKTDMHIEGLENQSYHLKLNGIDIGWMPKEKLERLTLIINTDGSISI